MEKFGLRREGAEWVLPNSPLLRVLLLIGSAVLLGIGALGWAQSGWAEGGWLLAVFGSVGVWLLLTALRMRQSIDVQRRAFVWRGAFGRSLLPFDQIQQLRPVHLTTNGAFQGVHVEAYTNAHPTARGRQVSPSFPTEAQAQRYQQCLQELMAT